VVGIIRNIAFFSSHVVDSIFYIEYTIYGHIPNLLTELYISQIKQQERVYVSN